MSKIRVGIAQIQQTADLDKNLDKALSYMEKASKQDIELLCFPETHLPGYRVGILSPDAPCMKNKLEKAEKKIAARCDELSLGVVLGTETPNSNSKPYNTAAVFDQHGDLLARHHKSKLTPKDSLAYSPGTSTTTFSFKGIPMGVVICFAGFRYPELSRQLAKQGSKIVFHPQFNHVLSDMEWKLPVHESLLVARAAENMMFLVSANMSHPRNNCRSLIIEPNGLIKKASELDEEVIIFADLDPDQATHAFLKDDLAEMARALGEGTDFRQN